MKKALKRIALVIALGAVALWLVLGANRGWTKTSVAVVTVDEVTGLEGRVYKNRFLPGLDFLGVALAGAGVLALSSVFISSRKQAQS
jgi:hypothetical protein